MPVPTYSAHVSGRLAHRQHQPSRAPLQGRIGPLHRRATPRCGSRSAGARQHGASHLGVGVPLRPGVPGRRRRRWAAGRPQLRQAGLREHRRATSGTSSSRASGATWSVLGAPAGSATLTLRYSDLSPVLSRSLRTRSTCGQRPEGHHADGRPRPTPPHPGRRSRPRCPCGPAPTRSRCSAEPATGCDGQSRHDVGRPRRRARTQPGATTEPAGWVDPGLRHLHLRTQPPPARRGSRRHMPDRPSSRSTPTACSTGPDGGCSTTPRARCGRDRAGSNPGRRTATSRTATSSSTATTTPAPCAHWPS